MKKKGRNKYRTLIKSIVCIIHIIVIVILGFCSFRLYKSGDKVVDFSKVKKSETYSYLNVSEMSEKITTLDNKKQIHLQKNDRLLTNINR